MSCYIGKRKNFIKRKLNHDVELTKGGKKRFSFSLPPPGEQTYDCMNRDVIKDVKRFSRNSTGAVYPR
jgi:hypothetical protein